MTDRNIVSMLFDYHTTNRTDYRDGEIKADVPTVYKKKPVHSKPSAHAPKYTQTITDWKKVDFSLMHKPKEIVRTNPYKVQEAFHKRHDEAHERARATRPRLVMTPAVAMDDIKDSETRKLLVEDTYLSTAHRAMEEAVMLVRKTRVETPFPGLPAPADPIRLNRLREPVVPPEWRRETVEWDSRQLRSHIDSNREFWMPFNLYKHCVSCKETAQVARIRKLQSGKH